MKKTLTWHPEFTPSYTPMEMLDHGIFEGIYTAAIPNIPKKYKHHKNVLPRGSAPDVSINRFKVKSRLSLKEWEKNKWTTKASPLGWWQWYILYFEGRRIPAEDEWQIKRWRSFVARHQGAIDSSGHRDDLTKRPKQRQALLQWGWDSQTAYTDAQRRKNLQRLLKITQLSIAIPNQEMSLPSLQWTPRGLS